MAGIITTTTGPMLDYLCVNPAVQNPAVVTPQLGLFALHHMMGGTGNSTDVSLMDSRLNGMIDRAKLASTPQQNYLLGLGVHPDDKSAWHFARRDLRDEFNINLCEQKGLWGRLKRWWSPITTVAASMRVGEEKTDELSLRTAIEGMSSADVALLVRAVVDSLETFTSAMDLGVEILVLRRLYDSSREERNCQIYSLLPQVASLYPLRLHLPAGINYYLKMTETAGDQRSSYITSLLSETLQDTRGIPIVLAVFQRSPGLIEKGHMPLLFKMFSKYHGLFEAVKPILESRFEAELLIHGITESYDGDGNKIDDVSNAVIAYAFGSLPEKARRRVQGLIQFFRTAT